MKVTKTKMIGVSSLALSVTLLLAGDALAASNHSAATHNPAPVPLLKGGPPTPKRGLRPGRGGPNYPGVIQAVKSSSFILKANGQSYTVSTNTHTSFSFGPGLTTTSAGLKVGEKVVVSGTLSDHTITATRVTFQAWNVRGKVTGIQGHDVHIVEANGRTSTIQLTSLPTVRNGEEVQGAGFWHQNTLDAVAFGVVPTHLDGIIVSRSGDSATIKTSSGRTVTIVWTSTTRITDGPGRLGSATLLVTSARIHAVGLWRGNVFAATHIDSPPRPKS